MERWCLERAQNSQTRIVVLNPTCVFGPYGWTYTMLPFELASAGRFCWIEHGSGLANVVYIENLIDAMLLAADNAEARGQRFIINDETLPWRSFLEAIIPPGDYPSQTPAELLEAEKSRRVPRLSILAALRSEQLRSVLARTRIGGLLKRGINTLGPGIAASLLPTLPKHSSLDSNQNESGLPPAWIADLYGPNRATFSSEKARKVLGWSPKVNMPAALDCTVRWLRKETLF